MLVYLAMGQLLSSPASANHDRTRTRIATRTRTGTITSTIATTRNGMRTETMTSTLGTRINLRTGNKGRNADRNYNLTQDAIGTRRNEHRKEAGTMTGTVGTAGFGKRPLRLCWLPKGFIHMFGMNMMQPTVSTIESPCESGVKTPMSAFQSFPLRKEPRVS